MKYINLNEIAPDPEQPRQEFDPKQMETLKSSIKDKGILVPLILEELSQTDPLREKIDPKYKNAKYIVIDGERRWRNAIELKLKEVPAEVEAEMTPKERMILRFHLQEQHSSWSPFDKARAIYFFIQTEHLPVAQVADLLGLHLSTIQNWITILSLSQRTQQKAIDRRIKFTTLVEVARISKKYTEITDMNRYDIENKLLDKVEKHAFGGYKEFVRLSKFLGMPGNEEAKLKFLKNVNFTIKNLFANTPEGQTIELDSIIYRCQLLTRELNKCVTSGLNKHLSYNQKKVAEDLQKALDHFV
jgi:ParB/RepB/Spo0J family partition protein